LLGRKTGTTAGEIRTSLRSLSYNSDSSAFPKLGAPPRQRLTQCPCCRGPWIPSNRMPPLLAATLGPLKHRSPIRLPRTRKICATAPHSARCHAPGPWGPLQTTNPAHRFCPSHPAQPGHLRYICLRPTRASHTSTGVASESRPLQKAPRGLS